MKHYGSHLKFWLIIVVAIVSFSLMFVITGIGKFDFWWWMSSNLLIFISIAGLIFRDYFTIILNDLHKRLLFKFLLGIGSAVALYLIFYIGNMLSTIMFDNAVVKIEEIYGFKGNANSIKIFLLMLLIIGPGEELFWRGFVQEKLMKFISPLWGFIVATSLYALVHVLTGNFMLIMAALIAGIFWGLMYLKFRSVTANVISHVIWDISIFILLPIS